MNRILTLICLCSVAILAAACSDSTSSGATPIAEILDKQDRYINRHVMVKGEVADTFQLSGWQESEFILIRDDSGEIWVETANKPEYEGATLVIQGMVDTGPRASMRIIIRAKRVALAPAGG